MAKERGAAYRYVGRAACPTNRVQSVGSARAAGFIAMNLYALSEAGSEEVFDRLHEAGGVRIERIVSQGQASPAGFWYDQPHHEWVLIVEGSAGIELEGRPPQMLAAGDHLFLPAGTRHRVAWTDPARTTIWLAVHYPVTPAEGPRSPSSANSL